MNLRGLAAAATLLTAPAFGRLPFFFEPNNGQTAKHVDFVARGRGYTLFLSGGSATLRVRDRVIRMDIGDAYKAKAEGVSPLSGRSNYVAGTRDIAHVPHFGAVRYRNVYPGVDLLYYGKDGQLEYDFIVSPGVDPARIQVRFDGASGLGVDRHGNLLVNDGVAFTRPHIFQEVEGRRISILGEFQVKGKSVSFRIGKYRRDLPLIIDPVLQYSSYLGGSGADELTSFFLDGAGSPYMVGVTESVAFPGVSGSSGSAPNCFVTKFSPAGGTIIYSTFLSLPATTQTTGSTCRASANASGDVVVVTTTPVVMGTGSTEPAVYKLKSDGSGAAWTASVKTAKTPRHVAVDSEGTYIVSLESATAYPYLALTLSIERYLNATGALVWRRALPAHGSSAIFDVAVDSNRNLIFALSVADLPVATTTDLRTQLEINPDSQWPAFLIKLGADNSIAWVSRFGRSLQPQRLAIGPGDDIWVAGKSMGGLSLKVTPGAYDVRSTQGNSGGLAVTRLSSGGSTVKFATHWANEWVQASSAVAVTSSGEAVLATDSYDSASSPVTSDTFQPHRNAGTDAGGYSRELYLAKLNAAGTALVWATWFGGSTEELLTDVAVTADDRTWVAGNAFGDLPLTGALQAAHAGQTDAFMALIGNQASACTYTLPASVSVNHPGGPSSVSVTATQGCAWTAASSNDWISLGVQRTGVGASTFSFDVAANPNSVKRTGTINLAGKSVTIEQAAAPCNYTVQGPIFYFGQKFTAAVHINTPTGCPWTATSNSAWITFGSANSGMGGGTLLLHLAENTGSGPRTGTVSVAGQTVTVEQPANYCNNTVSTAAYEAPALGGTGSVEVQTACTWEAKSTANWVQAYPLSGSGRATITLTVFPNFKGSRRAHAVEIGGLQVFVYQNPVAGTVEQRRIGDLYFGAFGRIGTDVEVVGHLVAGRSWADTVSIFLNSQEFFAGAKFVAGLYVGLLGRDAEYGGWMFQRNAMSRSGATPNALVANFLNSAEFKGKNPNLDDAGFIRLLYRQVLGREPDQAEVDFQAANLAYMGGRVNLASVFLSSPEYRLRVGPRLTGFLLFALLLQREPTAAELNTVASKILAATPLADIIAGLPTS